MENPRFRTAPDITDYKIPFAVNEQALTEWLQTLAMRQDYNSCKEIFCTLQAFTRIEIDPLQHWACLQKINTCLEQLVRQLERIYLDAGFPLSKEERAHVDIVTFAYVMLAENYSLLGDRLIARSDAPEAAFYMALQAAGKALKHMSQVYMQPYEGFWLFCYRIYSVAEQAGFLDTEIEAGDDKGKTVHAAFKHILVFELSGINQFRPREMEAIYPFLERFSAAAPIVKKIAQGAAQGLCAFNLKQDRQPVHLARTVMDDADRYISPVRVAKNLYQFLQQEPTGQGVLKSINRTLFMRVIKSLSLAQKRKYTRVAEQREGLGIVGFNNLISFLCKNNNLVNENLAPTWKKDPRISGNWEVPDLDLVPEGSEWMHQMASRCNNGNAGNSQINRILELSREASCEDRVWEASSIGKSQRLEDIPTGTFDVINSSAQGLYVLWKAVNLKVRVGDVFALLSAQDERVEIGLIRRVDKSMSQGIGLGIEMIGFESELVGLVRPSQKALTCWAVLLPGIKALNQHDSLVYGTSDFSAGEFVDMRHGKKTISCRLHKLINSTPAVSHVELFYAPDSI